MKQINRILFFTVLGSSVAASYFANDPLPRTIGLTIALAYMYAFGAGLHNITEESND